MLGIVTNTAVFHWSMEGDAAPAKMFDRTPNLNGAQIIAYRASQDMKWFTLVGIAPGDPSRPSLVKGNMQLYSAAQQRSQALEAHAAAFATHHVPGNAQKSQLVAFAQKTAQPDGSVSSKLHVIELGAAPGQTPFAKRQAELFFPPDFADDFPVSMHASAKYGVCTWSRRWGCCSCTMSRRRRRFTATRFPTIRFSSRAARPASAACTR